MSEIQQPLSDLGTPVPRATTETIKLEIDGQQIEVAKGTSVMRASALLGINVPPI